MLSKFRIPIMFSENLFQPEQKRTNQNIDISIFTCAILTMVHRSGGHIVSLAAHLMQYSSIQY